MLGYGGLDVWIAMWARMRECDYVLATPMHLACTQQTKSMDIHLSHEASPTKPIQLDRGRNMQISRTTV